MADQNQQSSYIYDVFVSFNGHDTSRSFTSHLLEVLRYRKINVFFNDEELQKGDEFISSKSFNALQHSQIAIVVLSDNYASTPFCLEELVYILDNFHGKVIPVFYHVSPSAVRPLKGNYDDALARHEERFKENKQKVQNWRRALNHIVNIPGFYLEDGTQYEYEYMFIERIVDKVFFHMIFTVGLKSPLKEVRSLLKLDSGAEVLMVGIHGAAGIGKTTLARVVYDNISDQFEAAYFLRDMGENSNSNMHGLSHLENMLLSEMVGMNNIPIQSAQEGFFLLQKTLQDKKVLLVLDGVDKLEQLEALDGVIDWFASGSRVIITTRDRNLLAFHGILRTHEVQPLNREDALELLSLQIFKEDNDDGPSDAEEEILNELVTYASGLPLALKVIGSYLFGKSVDEWTNALNQFKRVPPEDIQRKLKSSFDALREDEKRVFLDIACCFNGYELRKAIHILSAHRDLSVESHIKVLIDRSLISIDLNNRVRLHPLVEGMGKEIVRRESPDEPGKRSRLWFPDDIFQVLQHNMGTDHTEIIHLDSPLIEDERPIEWDGEAFKKMKNLRTLIIREWNFSKAPKYLPNSLRVLEWSKYPLHELPSDFNTDHLVICNLPNYGVLSTKVTNSLDRKIKFWSSGKEMDIRLLLSTLHQVMWPESGWEEISSMSLTESSQVKKAYDSALLLVHSDKLQKKGTTLLQKYIADNVFHILQFAKSFHEVSQSDPPIDPEAEALSNSSQEGAEPRNTPSDPEASSNSSRNRAEQRNPPSNPEALSNSSHETFTWFKGDDWKTWKWRLVGTLSGVVGPLCFALSPPSKCVMGERKLFFILCSVWSLLIGVFLHCVKPTLYSEQHRRPICYVVFLIISAFSFFYDKAVDNKPSVYSVVSNAAFALVSLSKSKLDGLGFETGIFCHFLACFTIQLMDIQLRLFFVGIILSCPLFLCHFPSKPKEDHTIPLFFQRRGNTQLRR